MDMPSRAFYEGVNPKTILNNCSNRQMNNCSNSQMNNRSNNCPERTTRYIL